MGFVDAQTQLCSAQAFSADAVSENTYDSGAALINTPEGEPLGIGIHVTVAAKVSGGTETYEFQAIQSADDALGSPDILALIQPAGSDLPVGKRFVILIPPGSKTKRYLGLNFNGENTPTITVDAFIGPLSTFGRWKTYGGRSAIS